MIKESGPELQRRRQEEPRCPRAQKVEQGVGTKQGRCELRSGTRRGSTRARQVSVSVAGARTRWSLDAQQSAFLQTMTKKKQVLGPESSR